MLTAVIAKSKKTEAKKKKEPTKEEEEIEENEKEMINIPVADTEESIKENSKLELGLLSMSGNKIRVGKRQVTFTDPDVYETCFNNVCKLINVPSTGRKNTLDENKRSQYNSKIFRVKKLFTSHSDFKDGALPLGDEDDHVFEDPKQMSKTETTDTSETEYKTLISSLKDENIALTKNLEAKITTQSEQLTEMKEYFKKMKEEKEKENKVDYELLLKKAIYGRV